MHVPRQDVQGALVNLKKAIGDLLDEQDFQFGRKGDGKEFAPLSPPQQAIHDRTDALLQRVCELVNLLQPDQPQGDFAQQVENERNKRRRLEAGLGYEQSEGRHCKPTTRQ